MRRSSRVNAYTANREWSWRPDDERDIHSISDMRTRIESRHLKSYEKSYDVKDLSVVPVGEDLRLARDDARAFLTYWSAGQLANLAGAPADYIRRLPAELAARNLNYGLRQRTGEMKLLIQKDDANYTARSINSDIYGRIFDIDVVNMVDTIATPHGFVPPMTNPKGVYGMPSPEKGSRPGGLYVSGQDMFMMLVNSEHKIEIDGELFGRGIIARNSEVGAAKYIIAGFMNRYVCGNSIIHGFKSSFEYEIVHKGEVDAKFKNSINIELARFVNHNTNEEVYKIRNARKLNVAKNDEDAVAWLRSKGFLKNVALAAVEAAKKEEGGAGTLWQLINGLTATARMMPHMDQRFALDKKAGKLLALSA